MSHAALIRMKKNVEVSSTKNNILLEKNRIYRVFVIQDRLMFLPCVVEGKRKTLWPDEFEYVERNLGLSKNK